MELATILFNYIKANGVMINNRYYYIVLIKIMYNIHNDLQNFLPALNTFNAVSFLLI